MKITYLYHSGFMIELEKEILIFDYYKGSLPVIDREKDIYFFVSHVHEDHFSFRIFACEQLGISTGKCRYILSNDIHKKFNRNYFMKMGVSEACYERITFLKAYEDMQIGTFRVRTLKSTDLGVAFLINTSEGTVYHAGDLNWWTWEGESEKAESDMERRFKTEIKRLEGIRIDVAFMTLDGRQDDRFYMGFDYFMRHTDTGKVYPMHFWDDSGVIDRLIRKKESEPYRDKIVTANEMLQKQCVSDHK